MNIVHSDFKKGIVKLKVTDLDDLWYLSHLIDQGDLVKGKTTRKIKIGDGENAKTTKKTLTLKIEAETIDFGAAKDTLRINGKIKEGPEDIPRDSYHAISLDVGSEFTLEKEQWLSFQKQKLKEAAEKQLVFLICLLDREEALFALTKKDGFEVLTKLKGRVPKKSREITGTKDFYQEIIEVMKEYNKRYTPEKIIVASPAFYKEELFKKLEEDLKKKVVLAVCSDVDRSAIDEVMKRPELDAVLKSSRIRKEQMIVEELLEEIQKDKLAAYGFVQVKKAVDAGAVKTIILTDDFVQQKREERKYSELDYLMKQVNSLQGKIHILSSKNDSGKKVDGLGGIAAILRYKLEW